MQWLSRVIAVLIGFVCFGAIAGSAEHGIRPETLVITNGLVVDGVGTPAEGPADIFIVGDRIERIVPAGSDPKRLEAADATINASGKYVLPGFINMHGHLHTSRAGRPMPLEYQYKLWLGSGITTVRDVGSDADLVLSERDRSAGGDIAAPRLLAYLWFPGGSVASGWESGTAPSEKQIRQAVRNLKKRGADGIKVRHFDRDDFLIIGDEARKQGMKIAHHVGIEDANAWDDAEVGTASIEHWYGVPDAAVHGVQEFPSDFNHANELHRFRYAGRLWREADPERVTEVLQKLVDAGVAWDPTLCIYEASRDLQRALTQPAFEEYLHPSLGAYFAPNPKFHGSFFFGWTNTDEVYWKENYRIWMQAVRDFADMGGIVTTGEDAGFIYQVYGFGYLRELQLHEEAGFHPLEVIKHATWNGAQVLGRDDELGRLKPGYKADVVIVNGNPLADLQILMPRGLNPTLDEQRGEAGGIEWTIKDGIPYSSPRLFAEVRALVSEARLKE